MEKERLDLVFEVYGSPEEMAAADRQLWHTAGEAARSAYAPYSGFSVGAAVLLENNTVVKGSNQENAAYPSGLCAERVAVFHAGSQCPGIKIRAIAVAAFLNDEKTPRPATPCGNCRQVIAEYEYRHGTGIRIIMMADKAKFMVAPNCQSLLPFSFNPATLRKVDRKE